MEVISSLTRDEWMPTHSNHIVTVSKCLPEPRMLALGSVFLADILSGDLFSYLLDDAWLVSLVVCVVSVAARVRVAMGGSGVGSSQPITVGTVDTVAGSG